MTQAGYAYCQLRDTQLSVQTDVGTDLGATEPIVGRARTPNETPKPNTAIEYGATFLAPLAKLTEPPGSSIGSRTLSVPSS